MSNYMTKDTTTSCNHENYHHTLTSYVCEACGLEYEPEEEE